jgi:hypothetical protein
VLARRTMAALISKTSVHTTTSEKILREVAVGAFTLGSANGCLLVWEASKQCRMPTEVEGGPGQNSLRGQYNGVPQIIKVETNKRPALLASISEREAVEALTYLRECHEGALPAESLPKGCNITKGQECLKPGATSVFPGGWEWSGRVT